MLCLFHRHLTINNNDDDDGNSIIISMGGQSTSSNSQNEVQADIITLVPIQIPSIHRDQSEQSDQRNRAATTSTTVEPLPLDTLPDTMTRSLEDQHRPTATQTDNSTLLSALTNDHIASPKFNPNQYDSARNANPIPLEIPSSLRARVSRSSSWPATNGKEIEFIAVREGLSRSRSLIIEGRGVEVYVTSCIPSKTDDDAVRIEIPSLTEQVCLTSFHLGDPLCQTILHSADHHHHTGATLLSATAGREEKTISRCECTTSLCCNLIPTPTHAITLRSSIVPPMQSRNSSFLSARQ